MENTGKMNKVNKIGPRTEPCGTPDMQVEIEDLDCPSWANWLVLER